MKNLSRFFSLREPAVDGSPSAGGGAPPAAPSLFGTPPAAPDPNAPPAPAPLAANWDATLYDANGALSKDALGKLPADMADLRGFLEKYPTRAEAFKSIPHLQRMALSKAGLKALPENATTEQRTAYNAEISKLLGVPEKIEGYGITKPDQLPEGMQWDDNAVNGFLAVAKENQVPPAAAKAIVAYHQKLVAAQMANAKTTQEQAEAVAVSELKAELPPGVQWAAFTAQVDRGIAQASRISGIPVERLNEMTKAAGLKDMSRFFSALAAASGEDAMPDAALSAHSDGIEEQIRKIESNPAFFDKNAPLENRQQLEAEYKSLLARKHGYSR